MPPKASPPCPTDVPIGVTAKPMCELTYKDGSKGCVLTCSPSTDEEALRYGDKQCGQNATCKAIQNVGVCTYGGSPSPDLPQGCSTVPVRSSGDDSGNSNETTGLVCRGGVSPEPGCDKINSLCCADQLSDSFSRILKYRSKHPFQYFAITCSGNFGGADPEWAAQFGGLIQKIDGLTELHIDLSFNQISSDAILDAIEPALNANPGLLNLSIILEASNLTDHGAARLGNALKNSFHQGTSLLLDLSRNDPGDISGVTVPITAKGIGNVASNLGTLKNLKKLNLDVGYDTNLTAKGMSYIANGISPLKDSLEDLTLNMAFMDVIPSFPANQNPNRYFACLAKTIASFTRLKRFSLDTDSNINDPSTVRNLGIHLACLPIPSIKLPGMNDGQSECHCGLAVDTTRECLIPNKIYSGTLGHECFTCHSNANSTACEE